jgi:aldehyde:ferredoxin oxidoreductase
VTTGIGAGSTTYGCINSHYFDATKTHPGGKGLYRTKQAGRTGLGTVMMDKKVRAVVILAEFPKGENPYGAADWAGVKEAGARLGRIVKEVDPQSLRMSRKGSAGLISFMNKEEYQSLPVHNYQLGSHPMAGNICGKFYEEHLFEHQGMDGCFPGCNLPCTKGGWVKLTSGPHQAARLWSTVRIRDSRRIRGNLGCGTPNSSGGHLFMHNYGTTPSPPLSSWPLLCIVSSGYLSGWIRRTGFDLGQR